MTGRKFYRTLYTVEVLSEEPLPEGITLEDINYEIVEGGCSGVVTTSVEEVLDGAAMAKALKRQFSDPEFFRLTEDGEDVGEK